MRLPLLLLSSLLSSVVADVSISQPTSGSSYTVDGDSVTVPITWIESNTSPKLTEITSYSFTICTGSNSDIDGIETLDKVSADDITDYSYDLEIPADTGSNGTYFVQVYAVCDDGYTIHYTNRFTLEGMTGTLETSGDDTSPPSAQTSINDGDSTTTASDLSASFSVYYTSQTGVTRYAPMQSQPGSTVTATTWSRKFPTSAVTYFSTIATSLYQVTTVTPGWSYTMSSEVNWATPAAMPSENGGWYNPSSRISSATLSSMSSSSSS